MTGPATAAQRSDPAEDVGTHEPEQFARAVCYGLLARFLSGPPDGALLAQTADLPLAVSAEDSPVDTALQSLKAAAVGASLAALADEYHALFIGVGRGELVPYGSWYRTGFMMDRPLALLRRDLEQLGIERREDVCEPEDHAAAVCETMGMLIQATGEIDFQRQQQFFTTHVEPWLGRFFGDLCTAKCASFYQTVGEFGRCFLDVETRYFGDLT